MGRARYLIVLVALALALPATATASPSRIYVASDPDYTVVLKAAGGDMSVLALDTSVFCTFTEPFERLSPRLSAFQGPAPMKAGPHGLEARIRPGVGPASYVAAKPHGEVIVGSFLVDITEESAHCQTVGYSASHAEVRFEAVRYEPAGGPVATKPPAEGEVPIYYGKEGGTEVLLENATDQVEVRGAAPARCPIAGKKPAGSRAPLFDDVTDAARGIAGSFLRTIHGNGKIGARTWSESRSISGVVGDGEIAGFYERTTKVVSNGSAPQHCTTGPLHFRALRYLPATP